MTSKININHLKANILRAGMHFWNRFQSEAMYIKLYI